MRGDALAVEKPSFTFDQIIKSTEAAKKFGKLREMAKSQPIVITENGEPDSVIMSYPAFVSFLNTVQELEEKLLIERMERARENPASLVSQEAVLRLLEEK
ncbi:prevent-host-death family protein [Hydrogenispora ethanolica]|uniref:Prevent-host-death family protein n=1 Tax=Hydrogenispora ethanolica TaxID=1082276 RepID=A0A4R1SAF1_HYDET|nr:type II toxin-antitoxin system prevent-host-death family antitoxin [Hydrogenispora ethanolica]TCL76495.1 prevent-host-death family protein [Hydrogenispora ethanolica]